MINTLWTFTQLLCTAIITLGGAGAIIASIIRWMRKPDSDRDKKLKGHEEMLDNDNKRIKELEREQKEMKEAQQVLMKSMLALMSHAIDGNHTEDLRLARDDMQNYLLRR